MMGRVGPSPTLALASLKISAVLGHRGHRGAARAHEVESHFGDRLEARLAHQGPVDVLPQGRRPRPGPGRRPGDLVVRPLVGEVLLPERQPENVDALLEALTGLVLVDAQVPVLARRAATTDADVDPATLEHVVEHRELLGDTQRVVPWQHDDARAHFEPFGPPRHVVEDRPRDCSSCGTASRGAPPGTRRRTRAAPADRRCRCCPRRPARPVWSATRSTRARRCGASPRPGNRETG